MYPVNGLVYDIEIARCIPGGFPREPGLQYCAGWTDYLGMGIAVLACCDLLEGVWHAYSPESPVDLGEHAATLENLYGVTEVEPLDAFARLAAERQEIIGFNSAGFDDKLIAAHGIHVKTTYDLLCEVRFASGQPRGYVRGRTRAGYDLGGLSRANLNAGKSERGADAPKLWQRGERGRVVKYCLDDCQLVVRLLPLLERMVDPTNGQILRLAGIGGTP